MRSVWSSLSSVHFDSFIPSNQWLKAGECLYFIAHPADLNLWDLSRKSLAFLISFTFVYITIFYSFVMEKDMNYMQVCALKKKRLLPYDMQVEVSRNKCLHLMFYFFVKSHNYIPMWFFLSFCSFFSILHVDIQSPCGIWFCALDRYFF